MEQKPLPTFHSILNPQSSILNPQPSTLNPRSLELALPPCLIHDHRNGIG